MAAAPANAEESTGATVFGTTTSAKEVAARTGQAGARTANLDGYCDIYTNGLGDFCIWDAPTATATCWPTRERASPSPPPVLLRTEGLRMPLDDYQLSPTDAHRLALAHRVLVQRCLRSFGLDPVLPAPPDAGPRTANERRYGLADPDAAAGGYWAAERRSARAPAADSSLTSEVGDVVSGRGARQVGGKPAAGVRRGAG